LAEIKSFIFSVLDAGNFSIAASSASFRGFLVHSDGSDIFEVNTIHTFFDEAHCSFFPRTPSSVLAASNGFEGTADLSRGSDVPASVPLLPSPAVEHTSHQFSVSFSPHSAGLLPTSAALLSGPLPSEAFASGALPSHQSELPAPSGVSVWLIGGLAFFGCVAFFAARLALGVHLARRGSHAARGGTGHGKDTIFEERVPETLIESSTDVLSLSLFTPVPELGHRSESASKGRGGRSRELWELSDDFSQTD
jgi:hypothetical protein